MNKVTLLLLLLLLSGFNSMGQTEASYSVNFTSNWSQATHPHPSGNLPSNAHWSKLVGAVHNVDVVFVEMGEPATEGVENIAELGSNGVFFSEVNTAISAGGALAIIDGDDLDSAEGEIFIGDIIVNEEFPLLTLLSMIAPSPDWMIAINGVSLVDTNGTWIDQIDIDLYPYDAGTDSGLDYTSPNIDTDPQEPITSLQGVAPFSNEIIGTITITLESVLGNPDVSENGNILFPNPADRSVTVSDKNGLDMITFYNVLGTEVLQLPNLNGNSVQIDLDQFSSGLYLVQVQDQLKNKTVKRLVKL